MESPSGEAYAKKRPPVRSCPRGAEDNILIRERLDPYRTRRSQCGGHQMSRSVQLTSLSTEQRFAVRRIAGPAGHQPRCRPNHVDDSRCLLIRHEEGAYASAILRSTSRVANRVIDGRENTEIVFEGQDRFLTSFAAHFCPPIRGLPARPKVMA